MALPSTTLLHRGAPGDAYEVRRSPRRRTLSVEVHPDLRVIVRAPQRADDALVAWFVAERRDWIERALERFRRNGHPPPRSFLYEDGETHFHLGQPLRLRVLGGPGPPVAVAGEELRVSLRGLPAPERVRRALEGWRRHELLALAHVLADQHFAHFGARGHLPPVIGVRAMRTRWGSLATGTPGGRWFRLAGAGPRRMTLNLALVRAPRECVEYVVVHELCHLEHRGHGPGFYGLLDRLMPDWRERRRRLDAAPTR